MHRRNQILRKLLTLVRLECLLNLVLNPIGKPKMLGKPEILGRNAGSSLKLQAEL